MGFHHGPDAPAGLVSRQGYVRFSMIPVVVITSDVPCADSSHQGTIGRLQKPFTAQKLLTFVRRHVGPARAGA